MPRDPHYLNGYDKQRRIIIAHAEAHPELRCWRCGATKHEHPPYTKTGKPNKWTAGHVNDGEVGGVLMAEMWTCNSSAGAKAGNRKRQPQLQQW